MSWIITNMSTWKFCYHFPENVWGGTPLTSHHHQIKIFEISRFIRVPATYTVCCCRRRSHDNRNKIFWSNKTMNITQSRFVVKIGHASNIMRCLKIMRLLLCVMMLWRGALKVYFWRSGKTRNSINPEICLHKILPRHFIDFPQPDIQSRPPPP